MDVQERFDPVVVGVNTTVTLNGDTIGGFLAATAGTVTVVDGAGTTIINAHPVAAGSYFPMPFNLQRAGGTFTTAGGASGTLGVG